MKNYLLLILFFCISDLFSQVTLQTVDFEAATGYTTSIAEFLTSENDYYTRLDYTNNSSSISVETAYTNFQGDYIFCMEDIGATSDTIIMTLSSTDITGYETLQLTVLAAAQDKDGISSYETTKFVNLYANIDGAGKILIGSFRGNDDGFLHKDDNLNGIIDAGETTVLSSVFTDFTFDISGTGSAIEITVESLLSAGNEEAAYDYIRLTGISTTPVELTSFDASLIDDNITLEWTTATEKNNYGFDVERSVSSEEWTKIGFVGGSGTSNKDQYYTFTDSTFPKVDVIKYRLKQIDTDGQYEYSRTESIDFSTITDVDEDEIPTEFSLSQNYPNPFNPATKIQYTIPAGEIANNVKLTVYNMLGQEVNTLVNETKAPGTYEVSFDASELTSGVYFYRLQSGNFINTRKMILMK